jgi:hypothetical protein
MQFHPTKQKRREANETDHIPDHTVCSPFEIEIYIVLAGSDRNNHQTGSLGFLGRNLLAVDDGFPCWIIKKPDDDILSRDGANGKVFLGVAPQTHSILNRRA